MKGTIKDFILRGPEVEFDIPNISVGEKLFNSIRGHHPDSVIIIEGDTGKEATVSEVLKESVDVASGLAKLGLTKNDVVSIIGENTLQDLLKLEDIKEAMNVEEFVPSKIESVEDIAAILCSSGTSGLPKGVALSHKALILQAEIFKSKCPKASFLHCASAYWVSGVRVMMATTILGAPRLLMRPTDALLVMKAIDKYQPSLGKMPHGLLSAILDHSRFAEFDYSSLMGVVLGGSPLRKTFIDKFHKLLPHCCMIGTYGLTEMGGNVSRATPPTDLLSLGTLLPNTQVKIIDQNTGEALGPGQEGEIVCKSPTMMIGYVGNEKATAESMDKEGWLHTGDLGKYNQAGILYMTGRSKEFFKVDGYQVSPEEIESAIAEMDGVTDVAVAGIAHEEYHLPMALVVKKSASQLTEEHVMNFVRSELSDTRQLRAGVRFVQSIPKSSRGKIKRREVQAMAEALYHGYTTI